MPNRETVAFVLVEQFSLIAFSSAVEPLRLANRLAGEELYRWHVFSKDGVVANSSAGIAISADYSYNNAPPEDVRYDKAFVVSGIDVHRHDHNPIISWLRKTERKGAHIGAICTGTHVLALAGLLDDHECTIHWENLPAFQENFPEIEVTNEIYCIDRSRLTCSGGTAAIDMMLNVIANGHKSELAAQVADQFIYDRIRDDKDHQRTSLPARLGVRHPKLLTVVNTMEQNLEEPLTRADLAETVNLSTRQLERLFRRYLSRSPARYYLELRLNKARLLLLQTNMSIIDIALACGFVSASHFSKCYRDFFGKTPRKERALPDNPGTSAVDAADEEAA